MYRWTLVLVAMWLLSQASCQGFRDIIVHKRIQKCGEGLTSALMLVCNYEYNKRAQQTYDTNDSGTELVVDGPWRSRSSALALINHPRMKRGVVDECCNKACSIAELSSYCLTDPKLETSVE